MLKPQQPVRLLPPHRHAGLTGIFLTYEGILLLIKLSENLSTTAFPAQVTPLSENKA